MILTLGKLTKTNIYIIDRPRLPTIQDSFPSETLKNQQHIQGRYNLTAFRTPTVNYTTSNFALKSKKVLRIAVGNKGLN